MWIEIVRFVELGGLSCFGGMMMSMAFVAARKEMDMLMLI
jgi:hypothetical protein